MGPAAPAVLPSPWDFPVNPSSRTGLSPFSTTQVGFNAISDGLKPETSQTVEGGWRLNTREVEAVVAAYAVQFKDRLLAIQQGPGC